MTKFSGLFSLALVWMLALASCRHQMESQTRPAGDNVLAYGLRQEAMSGPVDFAKHVRPIIEVKCYFCHNGQALSGKYVMEDKKTAFSPGPKGPRIVPGDPARSPFIQTLKGKHAMQMPAVGNLATAEEIRILEKWISEGAVWPDGPNGDLNH